MKRKMIYLALMLFVLSAASVNAQVNIGSDDDPHKGAILDLSQSTQLGLLLPHVYLENVTSWQLSGEATNGEGMLIYNTNDDVPNGNGKDIYVWTGSGWKPIGPVTLKRFELDKSHLFLNLGGKEGTITAQNFIGSDGKPMNDVSVTWSIEEDNATGLTLTPATGNSTTVTSGSTTGSFIVRATANGITQDCKVTIVDCSGVEDVEGNWYCTGNFGSAGIWMTQNLRSKQYAGGETLTEDENKNSINTACYHYPNADKQILTTHPEYGLLYTWAAANIGTDAEEANDAFSGTVSTRQGICPTGWHLPSDYEWSQLEKEIANSATGTYGTGATTAWNTSWETATGYCPSLDNDNGHGTIMKSATAVVGATNPTNGSSKSLAANGFDALLVGYGLASNYGRNTSFWSSSSSNNGSYARYRDLYYGNIGVYRAGRYKYYLCSVRCKKNDN